MASQDDQRTEPIERLRERAKELECLYSVMEILNVVNMDPLTASMRIVEVFPTVWQHKDIRRARIELWGQTFESPGFVETVCRQDADLRFQGRTVGTISIHHDRRAQGADDSRFLQRESRLLQTIAARLEFVLEDYALRRQSVRPENDRKDPSEPTATD
ncbi:MAG: hypothetical protein ACYTDY_06770 [Planctomycetota bacterium]|jgi:hypothetical protein